MTISSSLLLFLIIIITLSLFFGFLVFVTNNGWRILVNRRFFVFTLFASLWQIVNLLMLVSREENVTLFVTRLTFVTGVIGAYFLLRFVVVFPRAFLSAFFLRVLDISSSILTFFVVVISFTPAVVESVYWSNGALYANYGDLYLVFIAVVILFFMITILYAFLNYRKSDIKEQKQIKFMFLGLCLTLLFIAFTDLLSPIIFGNDYLSNFGAFSMLFLFGFTAYSIVEHQLFDIRVILTETATGIVVLAVLAQLLFAETAVERIINVIILLLVSYGGYLLIKSVQDEIRKKEQLQTLSHQLQQANEHLKELDKMKTEFVSLASHELLTPVSAIEGYLSMILDEHLAKVDDPKAAQYLDRIYRSSRRLARLVADMLNISRIEEGRLLVQKKDVNLSELIKQVIEEMKFKAEEKKQKIIFDDRSLFTVHGSPNKEFSNHGQQSTDNGQQFQTYGDPDKIKEIVVNLLSNGIKFSKDSGTITVKVETVPTAQVQEHWQKVEAEIKDRPLDDQEAIKSTLDPHLRELVGSEQLLISVKDEGIGIPQEELPKLFKKFHRVGDYTTAESQGTGLGLYISRALVELHHGRIWAASPGHSHGSTFTFSLPKLSSKEEIIALENQIHQNKEQLKPLARPMNSKTEDEL